MMPLHPVQICHSSTGVLTGARAGRCWCAAAARRKRRSAASWLRSVSGKVRQFTPSCRRLQQPIKVAKRHCDEVIQVKLHHKIGHPLFRFPFVRHLPATRFDHANQVPPPLIARSPGPRKASRCLQTRPPPPWAVTAQPARCVATPRPRDPTNLAASLLG